MKREQGIYRIDCCPARIRWFLTFTLGFLSFFNIEVIMKTAHWFVVALMAVVDFITCEKSLFHVVPRDHDDG